MAPASQTYFPPDCAWRGRWPKASNQLARLIDEAENDLGGQFRYF